MWLLTLVLVVLGGWTIAASLILPGAPRWAWLATSLGLGALYGCGVYSVLFFACVAGGAAGRAMSLGLAGMLALIGVGVYWKFGQREIPAAPMGAPRFPWAWLLAVLFGLALIVLVLDFQAGTIANPEGEWDAGAIWNLRGHYLASGPELWRRAISGQSGGFMLGASHPGYPLFLSSLLAGLWTAEGSFPGIVPESVSLLFALALALLLTASLAWRKSPALGLLAGLVLTATELYASQASTQYSDLLQGLAFLAALVALHAAAESGSSRLLLAAGLAIGFCPWIKNEGQPFAVAALAVAIWRFRGRVAWVVLGAAPGLAATAALKLMSAGREQMFPGTVGEALGKIADPARWVKILSGFGGAIVDAGPVWAHPLLMLIALAVVLRFVPEEERRARAWLGIPIAATLAAEFGLYLITAADLTWHLSTSVTRLVTQIWPSILWFVFLLLRAPESYFPAEVEVESKPRKEKKRIAVR